MVWLYSLGAASNETPSFLQTALGMADVLEIRCIFNDCFAQGFLSLNTFSRCLMSAVLPCPEILAPIVRKFRQSRIFWSPSDCGFTSETAQARYGCGSRSATRLETYHRCSVWDAVMIKFVVARVKHYVSCASA